MLAAVGAVVLGYIGYLGWRVSAERTSVESKVDAIIARADPHELAMPARWVEILLRVEDPTFRTNKGIDLRTPGGGMTTLSQGLGKLIFFDDFEPGFAKGELMALTRFALYPKVDKQRTLQAIIASAYFGMHRGRPVIGFADGARTWFGKSLPQLSDREFVELEAMLVAPDQLKPTPAGRNGRGGSNGCLPGAASQAACATLC